MPIISLRPLRLPPMGSTRAASFIKRASSSLADKTVLQELDERGFVAAITRQNLKKHVKSPTTIYAGVDPSASSLHVGNLLPLLGLLHFQTKGHQSIALIGGATGSIGDPSGRSTERQSLTPIELSRNIAGITSQVRRFFTRGQEYLNKRGLQVQRKDEKGEIGRGVRVLNNMEWMREVSLLDFLRGVGKNARVSTMLSRDSVKNRLTSDSGISYTEFTYQLLQAYDFSHLHTNHACNIQLGGSDQWGNIVAGIDLVRREKEIGEEEVYGLTIPLLTTSTGEKFGKSAGNAVWLDEKRTPASEFYQFFLRTTDADVEKYLRLFTFLPLDTIQETMTAHESAKSQRLPQKLLAAEVTELVHGPLALSRALTAAQVLYSTSFADLKADAVREAFRGDKRLHNVKKEELEESGVGKVAAKYGLCASVGEAQRLVQSGGFHINSSKVTDHRQKLGAEDLIDGHVVILRAGSKRQVILYVE
ncbi:tyrosine-tRNA ligase [Cryptococcus wingfieldii CBS 7118]|uniref:Tyrosine--tRNA ligase n=1 Tax=Cryptococcus wingfieldii CBS 7118 TaxID=1295528 RepID=A0A1E3JEI8_9TREE|nr:tyrosine-tRNA ligase [Cryptococcus wingfieldii CBS 7118]ODN98321.1 tyrosine-tRNA ligase [Cryptococcus wingfieldii CBS 7118]